MRIGLPLFFILFTNFFYAQIEEELELSIFSLVENAKFEEAILMAESFESSSYKKGFIDYITIFKEGEYSYSDIEIDSATPDKEKILLLINKSLQLYNVEGEIIQAYNTLREALKIALNIKSKILAFSISKHILDIFSNTNLGSNDVSYNYLLGKMKINAEQEWQTNQIDYYDFKMTMRYFFRDSVELITNKYHTINRDVSHDSSSFLKAKLNISNANFHNRITKQIDSSYYFIGKAEQYFQKSLSYIEKEKLVSLKISKAALEYQSKKPRSSLSLLNSIELSDDSFINKNLISYVNLYKHLNHKELNNEMESLKYHNLHLEHLLSLNESSKLQLISEYETKYQVSEKEKQILIEKQKRKQNQDIAVVLAAGLVLSVIIVLLVFKNTKRKQKIIAQEKTLETQILTTALKEQELKAIDAMIEGQEKERLRIANDLHDDLGGLMANVKLNFSAFKSTTTPELFNKTNQLIDDAYQKVRTVAHAKNAGVIAKQGLLKAVQQMADKISVSKKIDIQVFEYDLNKRLENNLEITIFRIIQELITNVIKHAEASQVSIYLTNHEASINIMVEDDGIGFNPKRITKINNGMGISTIDKRVEHLGGTMTIESEPNKGATFIIDIPL